MRPRVIVTWIVLLVLVGAYVLHERTNWFDRAPPESTGRFEIFSFAEQDLASVEVIYEGKLAAVMRAPDGQWFMHDASHRHSGGEAPTATAAADNHQADPELSAKFSEQLAITARIKADRRIEATQGLAEYGLANPPVMVAFYGQGEDGPDYSQPLDMLYVGDLLSTEYTYYAKRDGDPGILLIPRYYVALLLAMLYGAENAPTPMPDAPPPAGDAQ